MDTESPKTPDVDLPGQQHDQANLDIVVEPEPAAKDAQPDDAPADLSDEPGEESAAAEDPALGNTLIRPDNS